MHNPAASGAKKHAEIGGMFRTQWSNIPGAPQTALVYANTRIGKGKVGLGGYLYNDVTGPTKRNGIALSYAYHIPMANEGDFSLGIEGRLQQWSFDRARLAASLGTNDAVIKGDDQKIKGDAGFGLAYTTPKLQLGVSVSQLIQSKLDFYTGTGTVNEEAMQYRHFYAYGNYNYDIDANTRITPHALVVMVPHAPTEFQGGVRIEHNHLFWYGLAVRLRQSWMLSAGLKIWDKLNVGYSFDIYRTPLSVFDQGSNAHEIMLRYEFVK
jgi:type IX secretion system PorP/SprF family membrane protein